MVNVGILYQSHGAYGIGNDLHQVSWHSISLVKLDALNIQNVVEIFAEMFMYTYILINIYIYIWATVKISEDQFSREGLKMTSDMHETL